MKRSCKVFIEGMNVSYSLSLKKIMSHKLFTNRVTVDKKRQKHHLLSRSPVNVQHL